MKKIEKFDEKIFFYKSMILVKDLVVKHIYNRFCCVEFLPIQFFEEAAKIQMSAAPSIIKIGKPSTRQVLSGKIFSTRSTNEIDHFIEILKLLT